MAIKKPISAEQRAQRSAAGRASQAAKTPEQRKELARKAAAGHWGDGGKSLPSNAAEVVQQAAENGCTVEQIAAALGVGRTTFAEWREKYPELEAAMVGGRAVEHDKLVGALFEAATKKGNITAAIFLLKARHGYVEGVPLVQNSVSINYTLPAAMTPEQYVRTIEAEAQIVKPDAAQRLLSDSRVKRALKNDFAAQRRELELAE